MLRVINRLRVNKKWHFSRRSLFLFGNFPGGWIVRIESELSEPELRSPILLYKRIFRLESVHLALFSGQLQAATVCPNHVLVFALNGRLNGLQYSLRRLDRNALLWFQINRQYSHFFIQQIYIDKSSYVVFAPELRDQIRYPRHHFVIVHEIIHFDAQTVRPGLSVFTVTAAATSVGFQAASFILTRR